MTGAARDPGGAHGAARDPGGAHGAPPRRAEDPRHCAACGLDDFGSRLQAALDSADIPADRRAIVHSGGCASEIAARVESTRYRVPFGCALPFALGLGAARSELLVIALSGDGEAAGAGGNHLVHAARRADPVRVLVVNNEIVSATGGFPSPTTPRGIRTPATPLGSAARSIDLCELVRVAGASWIGREVLGGAEPLDRLLHEFILAEPFAFLEIRAFCYPALGLIGGYATPDAMREALERRAIREGEAEVGGVEGAASPAGDRFAVGRLWPRRDRGDEARR